MPMPHMDEKGARDSLFRDVEPTLVEECPDCGGTILVWVHHSGGSGFTQAVKHIPPDRENPH